MQLFSGIFEPEHGLATVTRNAACLPARVRKAVHQLSGEHAVLLGVVDHAFQPALTDITGAALKDVVTKLWNDGRQTRQVFLEKLLLQGNGRRRDNDCFFQKLRRHDRGQAVSDGFPCPRTRFKLSQIVAGTPGIVRGFGREKSEQRSLHHLILAGPRDEAGPGLGDLAIQKLQPLFGFGQQVRVDTQFGLEGGHHRNACVRRRHG